jgi:hypothetical protein
MSVNTQKPEAKGATLHQEFARPNEQAVDHAHFDAIDSDGLHGSDLKHMKDERVVMTDEQVSSQSSSRGLGPSISEGI